MLHDDVLLPAADVPPAAEAQRLQATEPPVPPRGGPVVDVRDHGARGDGVTDDAAPFRSALEAVAAAGGGTLLIPPATYLLNEPLRLTDDLHVDGTGATLIKTDGAAAYFVSLSGPATGYGSGVRRVRVDGLTFRGSFARRSVACGFALHHAQDVLIENCSFVELQGDTGHCLDLCGCERVAVRDCLFEGFLIPEDDDYTKIECIQLDQSRWGALSVADDPAGYDALFTRDVSVQGCSFLPREVDGISYPCPNPIGAHSTREGHRYENVSFTGNRVVDPLPDPPTAESEALNDHRSWKGVTHFPTIKNLIITDNVFVQRRPDAIRAVSVFSIDVSDLDAVPPSVRPVPGPVAPILSEQILISRNIFTGLRGEPSNEVIFLRGVAGGPVREVMITDNRFESEAPSSGTVPITARHAEQLTITGNVINGNRVNGSKINGSMINDAAQTPQRRSSAHPEHAEFVRTDPAFSPAPLWWWSGDEVTLPRLCRQLDRLAAGGVHNLVVINLAPTGPAHGALADDPPFLSERWWELWTGLVGEARRRGTRLWFYDQLGFSSAHLQGDLVVARPELAGEAVERLTDEVGPGERAELTCAGLGEAIAGWACPIDSAGRPVGTPIPLEVARAALSCTVPADASNGTRYRVSLAYRRRTGFDYLSPEACRTLFDIVHGEFERRLGGELGRTIAGTFQDELPSVPTWSRGFGAEFRRRCGYRIEPVLAALFDDVPGFEDVPEGGPATPARVRHDYQRVRAELAEEAFFQPLHDWHHRHGLLLGCDQQGPSRAAEPLATVRQYADYPRTHRWFSAPGSDHHGDAKIHSSLAHLHGGRRVWIEAFHSSGWGSTMEETFDWLVPWLLAGATLFDPHAVYYSTRGGWFEWAPPSSCWRQPYWAHYRLFADTVSRLSRLLGLGRHVCSVGVLHPTSTVQAHTLLDRDLEPARRAQQSYLALTGRMSWFRPEPGVLAAAGTDFDVLDDEAIALGRTGAGRLTIAAEQYDLVIVPHCTMLLETTASQLVALAESGGTVLVIGPVPYESDSTTGRVACARLAELAASGRVLRVDDPIEVTALLPRVATGELALRRRIGDLELLVLPAAPDGTATRQPPVGPGRSWRDHLADRGYDFDPDRWRATSTIVLPSDATAIEQWDPYSGAATPLADRPDPDGRRVEVRFDQTPLAVVVWRPGVPADEAVGGPAPASPGEAHELDPVWAAELVPTARDADDPLTPTSPFPEPTSPPFPEPTSPPFPEPTSPPFPEPVEGQLPRGPSAGPGSGGGAGSGTVVRQWRLDQATPDGRRRSVLVGHGRWAWRYGPAALAELPPPLPPDHRGPLGGDGWESVAYSLSHGIEKDPVHLPTLGPSGRVPEEFFQVDSVGAGAAVALRTTVDVGDRSGSPVTLAVGANAALAVWWNGRRLPAGPDDAGYLRCFPVEPAPGPNLLELRCSDVAGGTLRGSWALVTDPASYRRPEWLGCPDPDAGVTFRRELSFDGPVAAATLQLASVGEATLSVNGRPVATHGSFEPYGSRTRVQPYEVGGLLRAGRNRIEVSFAPATNPVAMLIDGEAVLAGGDRRPLITDGSWLERRAGVPDRPARPDRRVLVDPRFVQTRTRPHPLPASSWLGGPAADPGVVLPVAPDADPFGPRPRLSYRAVVPPGATSVRLHPVAGELTAILDGRPVPVARGLIELAGPERLGRVLELIITPTGGAVGGAVWQGPLEFDCPGPGIIRTGDWSEQGLAGFAGGVRYRQEFELGPHTAAEVDLGRVRGTAAVMINGRSAGTRIWSPYTVDVTGLTRIGENTIEVVVFNTLAGQLDDTSPTPMVYPGQRRAGLFGPVRLITRTGGVEEDLP
ncbi:glycosyl hydrolase [Microlunatus speluncae]|uniref:glycosyl hydrolase n=1 Tax=Microlunatus speluncae TaxID=2594267 RepID=UPI0012664E05|nr:glycosyl hydrolase [Microlunatus speluncae]